MFECNSLFFAVFVLFQFFFFLCGLLFVCLLFLSVVIFVVDFFLNNDQNIKKREVIASGLFTIKRVYLFFFNYDSKRMVIS